MKLSKLSNQTNSQDPQAVNSRVFVGNLNTFQCSKTDVERMFQKYGRLAGISMHKGYAFVQFLNPYDARSACLGEDGRNILSQVLDVNMVAEPKAHQIGRNRQNVTETGNDWDYYYDSYCSTMFPTQSPRPLKRPRLMTPQTRCNGLVNAQVNVGQQQMMLSTSPPSNGGGSQHHQQTNNGHHLHQQQQQQTQSLHGNAYGGSGSPNCHLNHHALGPMVVSMMQNMVKNSNNNGSLVAAEMLAHQSAFAAASPQTHMYHSIAAAAQQQQQQHQQQQQQHQQQSQPQHNNGLLGPFKVYSTPDTLICGNCRECFADLGDLLDHKRGFCHLRFTCKCQDAAFQTSNVNRRPSSTPSPPGCAATAAAATVAVVSAAAAATAAADNSSSLASPASHTNASASPPPPPPAPQPATQLGSAAPMDGRLLCAMCKGDFSGPWELMEHVQTTHMISIYEMNTTVTAAASPTLDAAAVAVAGFATPLDNSNNSSHSSSVVAAATTTTTSPTNADGDAVVSLTQRNNIDSIIGLDAAAVAVKLHQHSVATDGIGLSVAGPTSTDGDDIDLNDTALLSPACSSTSIKDEVLLFNLSTSPPSSSSSSSHRQHLIASPSSPTPAASPPPLHNHLHGHHHHHHHHHHLSLSAHDIGADSKRNGSTYSSRNSSPRPESASPTQQHADDSSNCMMSAALSIDATAGPASALGIVTSSLAIGHAQGSITTQ